MSDNICAHLCCCCWAVIVGLSLQEPRYRQRRPVWRWAIGNMMSGAIASRRCPDLVISAMSHIYIWNALSCFRMKRKKGRVAARAPKRRKISGSGTAAQDDLLGDVRQVFYLAVQQCTMWQKWHKRHKTQKKFGKRGH